MRNRRFIVAIAAIAALGLPASAIAEPEHEVAAGESLTSIAAADGLSVAQLAAANGLSPDAELIAGATLRIPPQSAPASAVAAPAPAASPDVGAHPTDEFVSPSDVGEVASSHGVSPLAA